MRILCVCDEGNNRSVHLASLLRYRGHDTIPVGVNHSSEETRRMLGSWCELAIFTDTAQVLAFPGLEGKQAIVWAIPDIYPRPFNAELHQLVRAFIAEKGL